ncbi:hypothetical protein CK203_115637 [Vitis vinifera]|uniref:Uncharacterized protein n=1 Tax=Vitis vinifera TaxID=29760 RepID=A0A438CQX1_VITVI|nr:hypothetical protein CK203_115637 [Vitis vinifera]
MDQTKGSMQKEEMIVSKKMWTTLFPPSVDCRQGHQSSSEPLFLGKSSSFSEVAEQKAAFEGRDLDVKRRGGSAQSHFEEDKEGFLGRWGPIFVVQQSQICLLVQKSEVKDSSLRGFVKFREWKTWSKSKPSSPKEDSNLMTGSQGNTMVSPSGEFLIDGLSPRKMAKVREVLYSLDIKSQGRKPNSFQFPRVINSGKPSRDRVSFRSPSPDPKTFRSVESSSENIHHWRLFRRTFPTTSFSDTARSAGGDLQFFPKHRKLENHPRAGHARFSASDCVSRAGA